MADAAQTSKKHLTATFVEDAADRWIIIECRDALEKKWLMDRIRSVVATDETTECQHDFMELRVCRHCRATPSEKAK